eukprot:c3904_g1_i1 orf=198-1316(-)
MMVLSEIDNVARRAPSAKPPFTLGQLKKVVPSRCFNRSLVRSSLYLAVDIFISSLLLHATRFISFVPGQSGWVLWAIYWILQGCVLTGVWVIAHECGHHAFSDYAWVDDLVGLLLHSCLLVPYFSWKYSHRRHHSNTGNIERDEVFVPKTRAEVPSLTKLLNNPPGRILQIAITLTLGWPSYLLFNVSGRKYEQFASHYYPNAPIFNVRERLQVLVSDVALLGVAYCLYQVGIAFGFSWLLKVYGIPLLIVNGFLVLITFLQHTHPALPHYTGSEWEWLRGALTTVDRDYGILNHVFHHIADTHVAHHIFSTMPHYHAEEATRALKPVLGEYYQVDSTPIYTALLREFKECIYVEVESPQETGILWYKNKLS